MPCCTRLLRRPLRPSDHPRFRYVSDGQGAIERWPLASPRSRGSAPWNPGLSCTAFLRRQLPFGAKRLRVIWRRECDVRESLAVSVLLGCSQPHPPLRRMCRRQSPASHASTHITFSLGGILLLATDWRHILHAKYNTRADCARSRRSPPEALRRRKLRRCGCTADLATVKAPELRHGVGSLVRIRIQPGRSPEARQRRREAARRKNAVQDMLGGPGLQPLGEREARVLRMKIAELVAAAPRSAGMQGAAA